MAVLLDINTEIFNKSLIESFQRIIGFTIEKSLSFEVNRIRQPVIQIENVRGPKGYSTLINMFSVKSDKIYFNNTNSEISSLAFITFNYDLALDFCIKRMLFPQNNTYPNYGLDMPNIISSSNIYLLKLHGSTNWRIDSGNNINVAGLQLLTDNSNFHERDNILTMVDYKTPYIVPPSWSKSGYYQPIKKVWSKATEILREANEIYIMGYSLPATDHFFRYLFALSPSQDTYIQKIHVFNPDCKSENPGSNTAEDRYDSLMGGYIKNRYRFSKNKFDAIPWKAILNE